MNPIAALLASFRAWRNNRRALKAHEEWEKVMEQKKQERQSNSLPHRAWHDHMNRRADSILKRLNRPKQTEGGKAVSYSTDSDQLGRLWRHAKTGGIYTTVSECRIEATNEPGILYRSVNGGPLWCRPMSEFLDGRFVPVEVATRDE